MPQSVFQFYQLLFQKYKICISDSLVELESSSTMSITESLCATLTSLSSTKPPMEPKVLTSDTCYKEYQFICSLSRSINLSFLWVDALRFLFVLLKL